MKTKTKAILGGVAAVSVAACYETVKRFSPLAHPLFRYVLKQVIRDDGLKTYAVEYHFAKPLSVYVKAEDVVMMRGHYMEKARRVNYGLSYIRFEFEPFDSEADFEIQSVYRWLNVRKSDIEDVEIDEITPFQIHEFFPQTEQQCRLSSRLMEPQQIADEPYPLVVFLHDFRGRGSDNLSSLTVDRSVLSFASSVNQERHPCFVYVPQLPANLSWANPRVLASLDCDIEQIIMANPAIDRQRIYVTGQKEGGQGAYYLLVSHPQRFAGAVLMNMSGLAEFADRLEEMPIWFVDNENADIEPYYREELKAKALSQAFPNAKYCAQMHTGYRPEILDWLFLQTRKEES